jgi:DNA-binding Lrp family transcriptional regulator
MRLQDVLRAVPGVEKRFVHYLESQGYIHPAKLQKARIARRDYSEQDLRTIRAIWRYYQRGISVQRAHELLTRGAREGAYVFFPAPVRRWADALRLLREDEHVLEVAAVYGETADILARLSAPHDSDIHAILDRLFEARIITGLPRVHRFRLDAGAVPRGTHGRPAEPAPARGGTVQHAGQERRGKSVKRPMRAWVLIKVPAKQIGGLVEELRSYPGVVEASAIYGETDVIAKVEVPDQDALDELVFHRIQGIEAVESTRTFIAVGTMQWQR